MTYQELEETANQGAHLFRSHGLQAGDHIAVLLENHPRFFQICFAAQRAGLYYTAISWRLQQEEVEYIVNNCEAQLFISSVERKAVLEPLHDRMPNVQARYMVDDTIDGYESWEAAIAKMPTHPIADQREGVA
ncbi:MAG TPA: acyl-CoA synthetase, partial [Gammaproteobacteria bacterium]|nr:acyl-CoA synthetase [Gammaproteobacteria bacterium]